MKFSKKKVNEELNWWNYVVKGFEIRNDKKINNKYNVCMKDIHCRFCTCDKKSTAVWHFAISSKKTETKKGIINK